MPRHVARNKGGEQLVVSYMLLPNSQHALVSYVDRLPMPIQRAVIGLLESPEAQRTEVFAEVLGRRTFADSGKTMLQVLAEGGHLQKVSVDDVMMTPRPNIHAPLRNILEDLGRLPRTQVQQQAQQQQQQPYQQQPGPGQQGFNPHTYNQQAAASEESLQQARNLIMQAEMMEGDARTKRAQAYSLAPQLDPARNQAQPVLQPQALNEAPAAPPLPVEEQLRLSGISDFGPAEQITPAYPEEGQYQPGANPGSGDATD